MDEKSYGNTVLPHWIGLQSKRTLQTSFFMDVSVFSYSRETDLLNLIRVPSREHLIQAFPGQGQTEFIATEFIAQVLHSQIK